MDEVDDTHLTYAVYTGMDCGSLTQAKALLLFLSAALRYHSIPVANPLVGAGVTRRMHCWHPPSLPFKPHPSSPPPPSGKPTPHRT